MAVNSRQGTAKFCTNCITPSTEASVNQPRHAAIYPKPITRKTGRITSISACMSSGRICQDHAVIGRCHMCGRFIRNGLVIQVDMHVGQHRAPRRAVLTNMHIDLDYQTVADETPAHVTPAYDGMILTYPA